MIMGKMTVVRFGDYMGCGAAVRVEGLFFTRTWTVLPEEDDDILKKWTCIENGSTTYAHAYGEKIERFYKAAWIEKNGLQG